MNDTTTTTNLIQRQQERLHSLREEIDEIARTVSDETWDSFEIEVEQATEDQYLFDMASATRVALSGELALAFEKAFESHVIKPIEAIEQQLIRAFPKEEPPETTMHIDLAGMRKGLKLQRHASEKIGEAIERAKPGLLEVLFMSHDILSDEWEEDQRKNARRLRKELLALKPALTEMMEEETKRILQKWRLSYATTLESMQNTTAT